MAVKGADLESELIDTVCERVRERLPTGQVAPCESFIRQYYQWVPAEDLADRNPLDLYGAGVAHYNLAQQRRPGESKVRVYNPDFEQHGWQSPHTLIEIVTDDMPFIVDSVTMQLGRLGYGIDLVIHPVIQVRRDAEGHLIDVLEHDATAEDAIRESVVHVEVGREHDRVLLEQLRQTIERVLADVRAAVEDWQEMRAHARALIDEFDSRPPPSVDAALVEESKAFLAWLADDNFTFLGYREYDLIDEGDEGRLQAIDGSGLGILRGTPTRAPRTLSGKALAIGRDPQILLLTKANSASPVHRPAYLDYIGVKRFSDDGQVIGERRFLGLYTTNAYKASPRSDPDHSRQGRGGAGARRVPAGQPRSKGAARDPRVLHARLAVPDGDRGPVQPGDRDPRARRAPAAAAVHVARPARAVRRVPGVHPARPVQHRAPRAGGQDPARGARWGWARLDAPAE